MMSHSELHNFMTGRTLYAIDPETGARVAEVIYGANGSITARFSDGTTDTGQWGMTREHYWTQYQRFRSGTRNMFYLVLIGPDVAQAYHEDGRRAFVQTPDPDFDGGGWEGPPTTKPSI